MNEIGREQVEQPVAQARIQHSTAADDEPAAREIRWDELGVVDQQQELRGNEIDSMGRMLTHAVNERRDIELLIDDGCASRKGGTEQRREDASSIDRGTDQSAFVFTDVVGPYRGRRCVDECPMSM